MTDWTEKIHCGNALAVLGTIPDKMVQCIVTSPPYYGLRDYGHADQLGLEETPDAYVANMVAVFREARRVLKDDGVLWLNLGDSYAGGGNYRGGGAISKKQASNKGANGMSVGKVPMGDCKPKDLIGIPWMVAFALRADGWYLRQEIIWHKPNPMPESVKDRCVKSHEQIFLLSKSERYYFDYKAIQEPSVRAGDIQTFGGKKARFGQAVDGDPRNGHRTDKNSQWGKEMMTGDMANKRSVWTVPTAPYKHAHFAVFPPNLIRPCILAGSREGDIVMDTFAGSGTTWQVCLQHERKFVGIELNQKYIDLAEERVRPYQNSLFKI